MQVDTRDDNIPFFVPVKKDKNFFVICDEVDLCDLSLSNDNWWVSFLERNHTQKKVPVKIGETTYQANVFISNNEDEYSYVCVDKNYIPIDIENTNCIDKKNYSRYFKNLYNITYFADSFFSENKTSLYSHYVVPKFNKKNKFNNKETSIGFEDVLSSQHVLIVGDAGCGKTSFLRKYALDLSSSINDDGRDSVIPIYAQLRSYDFTKSLSYGIRNFLIQNSGEYIADNIDTLGGSGKLIFLFDGLDEIPNRYRERFVDEILDLSRKYSSSRIAISTRPSVVSEKFNKFETIEICPFNYSQIKEFSYRNLYKKKSWRNFVSCLASSDDIIDLISNPLLLGISTFLYSRNSYIPQNRAQLLKDLVEVLIETWDSSRNIQRYYDNNFTPAFVQNFLGKLSYGITGEGLSEFSLNDVDRWMGSDYSSEETSDILDRICEISGIIQKTDQENWQFSHLSLQEYFAASFLVSKSEGLSKTYDKYSNNEKWEKVWHDSSGLTSDPEYLLSLFSSENTKFSSSNLNRSIHMMLQSLVLSRNELSICNKSIFNFFESINCTTKLELEDDMNCKNKKVMIIEVNDKNKNYEISKYLVKTLRNIYALRFTKYFNYLIDSDCFKKNSLLSAFSVIFKEEGNFNYKIDNGKVSINIDKESPDIPFE